MNEMETARAIASGQISSPQMVAGFALWAIRITSTGAAMRTALNELVWRPPEVWLNPETLARVAALPVIFEHPDGKLTSEEYSSRTVGTIQYAYIADGTGVENTEGPDIWAVCRLYNSEMIAALVENKLSTSPGVAFRGTDGNQTINLEDGSHILLESNPSLMCHIAIVPNGVWDKGGDPNGIRTDADDPSEKRTDTVTKESTMSDETEAAEKKAREDKEKADARRDEAIDKVLSGLDAVMKRQDAWEKEAKDRQDAEEKSRRDAEESAMMDAKKRRDEEHEEWKKEDAEACERDDAEEKAECDAHEAKGDSKEVAADKARKDRRKRMDARRKDAEKEEKDRKDAQARADAAKADADSDISRRVREEFAKQQAKLVRSDADSSLIADEQMRVSRVHSCFGTEEPHPMQAETLIDYQVRAWTPFQKYSSRWKTEDLRSLTQSLRNIAIEDMINDSVKASRNHDDLPDGQLIPIRRTDPETGHRITEFRGRTTIFKSLSAPSQRVTAFLTANRGA